jgi:hypothetical protein
VAKNPDPTLELTTITGVTHTLDDWNTVFHLVLVCLPGRPEAATYTKNGVELLSVFRGADCRGGFLIQGTAQKARRVLGPAADDFLVFLDEGGEFVKAAGLSRLPALVHLGNDSTVMNVVEGWDAHEWTTTAKAIAGVMSWSYPVFSGPRPFKGWAT